MSPSGPRNRTAIRPSGHSPRSRPWRSTASVAGVARRTTNSCGIGVSRRTPRGISSYTAPRTAPGHSIVMRYVARTTSPTPIEAGTSRVTATRRRLGSAATSTVAITSTNATTPMPTTCGAPNSIARIQTGDNSMNSQARRTVGSGMNYWVTGDG